MDDKPLEKDFQRTVLKRLRKIPYSWFQKLNDRATSGLPDIIGSVAGVFVAIELKTKSKLTPIQAYTLRKIDHTGAQTFVMNPENAKTVFEFLEKIARLGHRTPTE